MSLREQIARRLWRENDPDEIRQWQEWLGDADAALAAIEALLEAMRRHIRSYEPGTLVGSELYVAQELRKLDGEVWEPWCMPGELEEDDTPIVPGEVSEGQWAEMRAWAERGAYQHAVEMVEASGTHLVVPVEPAEEMLGNAVKTLSARRRGASASEADVIYRAMLAARPKL